MITNFIQVKHRKKEKKNKSRLNLAKRHRYGLANHIYNSAFSVALFSHHSFFEIKNGSLYRFWHNSNMRTQQMLKTVYGQNKAK